MTLPTMRTLFCQPIVVQKLRCTPPNSRRIDLDQFANPLMRPAMIVSTDVMMPAIDPTMPGKLSHIFMTDILRKQFGYDGVVITDALYMGGISARWSQPQAAVLAIPDWQRYDTWSDG